VAQVYIPEKKSAIDKIMQGLQVAQSVYGIKSAYDQNKLREAQLKEQEQAQKEQEKLKNNVFSEQQAKGMLEADAGDKRAQLGQIEIKKQGGEPEYKPFWFISPERIKQESQLADLDEQQRRTRLETQYSDGRIRPEDYNNNITVFGGKSPGTGFRKTWDIADGKRVDIWIKPFRSKSFDMGSMPELLPSGATKAVPLITLKDLKTPAEKAGYRNAVFKLQEKGVSPDKIPYVITIEDVYAYNPTKIEKDRADISNKLKSYNDLMPTIKTVDQVIGGMTGDKPIPGRDQLSSALKLGMVSNLTSKFGISDPEKIKQAAVSKTSKESQRLWTALSALKSDFNKLKSGLSLTASELAAAENSLGVSEWATDEQLRQGIRNFTKVIRSGMQNVESGYHDASIDAYKKNPKSVTSDHPLFNKLDDNLPFVTNPKNTEDAKRNSAINFIGG